VVGGYERLCAEAVARWRSRGWSTTVLTLRRDRPTPSALAVLPLELRVLEPVPRRAWWARRTARSLASAAATRGALSLTRPDVIVTWGTHGIDRAVIRGLFGSRVPSLAVVMDYALLDLLDPPWDDIDRSPRLYASILSTLDRVTGMEGSCPSPDHWAFCSEAARHQYRARLGMIERDLVIHLGVPVPAEPPPPRPDDGFVRVGMAARLVPEKGVLTLLRAAEILTQDPGPRLSIDVRGPIADPVFGQRLRDAVEAAQAKGAAVTLGPSIAPADMPQWLARQDVLVMPFEWAEPFSLALLEAMAAARAVLATPVGGSAEILEDDVNALVFEPGNAGALAGGLDRLRRDPKLRNRLAGAGFATVSARFRRETMEAAVDEKVLEAAAG
jgi:glycosyltransferase involved in cell wall biosynthesis